MPCRLSLFNCEREVDIASRGVAIGADFLVRFLRESQGIGFGPAGNLDLHSNSYAKSAAFAGADGEV